MSRQLHALALLLAGALLLSLSACTTDDGRPWGEIRPTLVVEQDFTEQLQHGALRSNEGFLIEIEELALVLEAFELALADGSAPTSFDPSNPPDGYSLCHNGHCHHADGRLVSYEEIVQELAGDTGASAQKVRLFPENSVVEVTATPHPLALEGCEGCTLDRGDIRGARLYVDELELKLHVRDERTGDDARLPAEGVQVIADLHVHAAVFSLLELSFGPGHKPFVNLEWVTYVMGTLFDDIAWDQLLEADQLSVDLSENEDFEVRMREAIEHHLRFEFAIERTRR